MKNTVFLIVSAVCYIGVIIFLVWKIRDICVNREKYSHDALVAEGDKLIAAKKYRIPFKSLSHQYGMVGMLFTFALTALETLIGIGIQKLIFTDGKTVVFGTSWIGVICLLFLNIFVGTGVIPLAIKKPFFEVATRDLFNVASRSDTYKFAYIATLVTFAVVFPFAVLSVNNYAYYNDSGITYSKFFELTETTAEYGQIDKVKVSIHNDNNGKVNVFEYIITYNGNEIDINNPNTSVKGFTEGVFEIHKNIEKYGNCDIEIRPLTDVDYEYINNSLNPRQQEIVRYIYSGSAYD